MNACRPLKHWFAQSNRRKTTTGRGREMNKFQVVVGNIGHVFDGNNYMQARAKYSAYVKASRENCGRAAGEPVTLFHNGEIKAEYFGTLENQD